MINEPSAIGDSARGTVAGPCTDRWKTKEMQGIAAGMPRTVTGRAVAVIRSEAQPPIDHRWRSISAFIMVSAASSWSRAMNSSGWWAWSMEPGPQTTVDRPAAWNSPASAA